MKLLHTALPFALAAACANALADGTTLMIDVDGVRNSAGTVRASLYREEDPFRKEAKAFRLATAAAAEGAVRVSFTDLPPGRYAVMVYHDENSNEKLDLRLGMFPLEGYGLSNNPKVFGPPPFADSAFNLPEGGHALRIALSY